ncbi:two-component regulator propeller domain-containing protein [Croceivirga sp. JEA036]|uniref:two-component regulator propeller domain-containing protein n=1 Tax=Croceivirga sp. JEA036 TaxID=2721162 RepID=UPI001438F2BF|nr:two-component regulator propeller domain-containing protein [Croceivirga sp. JEA036]NJB35175.1 response regulator [Croceivirga sp. JEA036]
MKVLDKVIRQFKGIGVGVLMLVFSFAGNAQETYYFDHIGTGKGLSQSDVNCIYQDAYGYMWFGTHDGLNKYDGYSFTVYKPEQKNNTISSNLIFDITGDDKGNLWIGTTGDGLLYYDREKETFRQFKYNQEDPNSLANNYISSLHKDSKNRLWIATKDGMNMLDLNQSLEKPQFLSFKYIFQDTLQNWPGGIINDVYETNKGELLIAAFGLFRLKVGTDGQYYFQRDFKEANVSSTIGAIGEDQFNRLLVGTNTGLYIQLNEGNNSFTKIHDASVMDIILDNANHIWAGTDNGLLYFDNAPDLEVPQIVDVFQYRPENPNSLSKNIVTALDIDNTGILWVGTNGGGVNKFDPNRKQFKHVKKNLDANSLSYDKIRSLFEDSNGTLWVGTEGGGLNRALNSHGKYSDFKTYNMLRKVFALEELSIKDKKYLLIGGQSNSYLYALDITNPNNTAVLGKEWKGIDHSVFSLLKDSQNNLWIGTYSGGLYRWMLNEDGTFTKKQFKWKPNKPNGISNNIVRNIYEDSKANIWIATGDGLCMLPVTERYKEEPTFKVYKHQKGVAESLSHNYILAMYESKRGNMWVGTFGGGLNKITTDSKTGAINFKRYGTADGLPNNVIKGILEDDQGYLWISTNKGLSRLDTETDEFKNFDVADGLQDSEFQELACVKRKDGELVFGGVNGFNAFYPRNIIPNDTPAETVVTKLSLFNNEIAVGEEVNGRVLLERNIAQTEELTLNYSENSFSFEFASLHFAAPDKNRFAYMLDGFDQDWTYTDSSKRFATYTNIEPGRYTLKVKATNNDGVWDQTPYTLKVKVRPPIYRTTVAYIVYGIFFLLFLWSLLRFTLISTSKKHQLELEHLEKKKNDELQRVKLDFFTNISHEFKTPLTLIKAPLEYLQGNIGQIENENLKEQYALMEKNTNYLQKLVNQLLDFRKINQGKMSLVVRNTDVISFVKEVAEPFQFLAFKKQIKFNIKSELGYAKTWFDHSALEKIINNLLSNAFKFTPDGGEITLEIATSTGDTTIMGPLAKQHVIIKVIDSGKGIPDEKKSVIFEKYYTEKEDEKVNSKGIGIGLTFTKSLIELHLGKIEVTDNANGGTCFTVKLPSDKSVYENAPDISCKEVVDNDYLVRSSESESMAIDLNDELEDYSLSKGRSKNPVLLIVDDNPDILKFIKQVLSKTYTIFEANNGERAFEIAKKVVPNIIITDVVMPVMGGIELCEKIKTTNTTSHIPVVMLTAKASQESEIEGLSHGADAYLRKPFNFQVLELKLSNILKNRQEVHKRFQQDLTLQPTEVSVTSLDQQFLQQAVEVVEKHMMNTDFNVEMLVKEMGHSRSNLYLKFKELTGLSSSEFIRNIRLKRAIQLLDNSDYSVKEIMFRTGFNTASYFSKCFKKEFGVVPSEYIKKRKVIQD